MAYNNDYLPVAFGTGANVLSQEAWKNLATRTNGLQAGVARSNQFNKIWRQSSVVSSMIGKFCAEKSESDVFDDGDVDGLYNKFLLAIGNTVAVGSGSASGTYYGDDTGTTNAVVVAAPTPAISALVAGIRLYSIIANDNDGSAGVTLNLSGLGAKPVSYGNNIALWPGALKAGSVAEFVYNGSRWLLVSSSGDAAPETIQDMIGAFLTAGSGITLNYNDAANTLSIASSLSSLGQLFAFSNLWVRNTPGAYTYTPSTNATRALVLVQGAGGPGGMVQPQRTEVDFGTPKYMGGGGGALSLYFADVSAGADVAVTVGAASAEFSTSAGGTSSFGAAAVAEGGHAGSNGSALDGLGGVATAGSLLFNGSNGQLGSAFLGNEGSTCGVGGSGLFGVGAGTGSALATDIPSSGDTSFVSMYLIPARAGKLGGGGGFRRTGLADPNYNDTTGSGKGGDGAVIVIEFK